MPVGRGGGDLSAVRVDDGLGYGKPYTVPAGLRIPRLVGPVETVENAGQSLFVYNIVHGIADRYDRRFSVLFHFHRDLSALRSVLHGVFKQD